MPHEIVRVGTQRRHAGEDGEQAPETEGWRLHQQKEKKETRCRQCEYCGALRSDYVQTTSSAAHAARLAAATSRVDCQLVLDTLRALFGNDTLTLTAGILSSLKAGPRRPAPVSRQKR